MSQKFNCPNCGAPIEYSDDQETATCTFCGTTVPLPAQTLEEVKTRKLSSQGKIWLIVFLIIIIVPTCIGFGGSMLGALAGLIGTLVGVIAPFLGH